MKYLLAAYTDPVAERVVSDGDRAVVLEARARFVEAVTETGELLGGQVLTGPESGVLVRQWDGVPEVVVGLAGRTDVYLAGYYLVDCETRERAVEVAASAAPDTRFTALEVRPVMSPAGMEM